ncbi:helix-turn-helix domain-containing protein [Roseateles sp. BYS180W]|uniref:Helix-turn-helix domain-containing protein n=1 Tax=Roseateles rivi TaxID=3299028 RepID=A0ABW7FWU3_9BURK
MKVDLHPDTVSRLMVPSLTLGGCVQAYLWRDTARADGLTEAQRHTHFPATSYCGIAWTLQGQSWQLGPEGQWQPLASRVYVAGPRTRPVRFVAEGGLRMFTAVFSPDALHALTGISLPELVDVHLTDAALPGPEWAALNRAMLSANDEAHCQQLLEAFLVPRWRNHCAAQGLNFPYRDWAQNLALRAVASGRGESLRQLERRFKRWAGQSPRVLRQLLRGEQMFSDMRRAMTEGEVVWSAVAQDHGYADQAHLCRETRRITGFSPEQLRLGISHEEAFWAYRIWR